MTIKKQWKWQAHWAEFLSRFNFVIFYTPGRENRKVNLLIHRPKNYPADNQDD